MAFENHPAVFAAGVLETHRAVLVSPEHWHCQLCSILLYARFASRACVLTLSEYEAGRGLYGII